MKNRQENRLYQFLFLQNILFKLIARKKIKNEDLLQNESPFKTTALGIM